VARRIAAILLLEPALDANYEAVKANAFPLASQALAVVRTIPRSNQIPSN